MRPALLTSAALLVVAGAARAQPAPSAGAPPPDVAGAAAANAAGDVVVVANRRPERLDKVGQSVTVLTLPQIRADQELAVSDILARTPGVNVSRNGGPGQVTAARIRGAETDQTAVLIDGVKLDDPSSPGGGYNFADLLTGDISRIEVLRGPQSTLYGSPAIGGVVNIVTADPTRPLEGDVQAEGGSYATGYAKAAVGGRQGALTFRAAASTYTTDGVSAFDSRRGGREDDGYQNTTLTGRLGYAFTPSVALHLRAYYVDAKNQFDGFSTPTFSFGDDPEFGRTTSACWTGGCATAWRAATPSPSARATTRRTPTWTRRSTGAASTCARSTRADWTSRPATASPSARSTTGPRSPPRRPPTARPTPPRSRRTWTSPAAMASCRARWCAV